MKIDITEGEWKNHRKLCFEVGGRESFIVCPDKPAPGNPWVWRAEFFGAFDTVDTALLERGWYLAYHRVSDMYGCPESLELMREFNDAAVENFSLNAKTVLFGFSRGGLYAFNYAAKYPEKVAALYLDAPVLDIRSWPGGLGRGDGSANCWKECLGWYKLTAESVKNFKGNPLDKAGEVAKAGIPMIIVAGDADTAVPFEENSAIMEKSFKDAGGVLKLILKPGVGHHPHSLEDPKPVVDFILAHTGQ